MGCLFFGSDVQKFVLNLLFCIFRYGCPSIDEIESFSKQYKTKLDEIGATGEIPDDLALEVITYYMQMTVFLPFLRP